VAKGNVNCTDKLTLSACNGYTNLRNLIITLGDFQGQGQCHLSLGGNAFTADFKADNGEYDTSVSNVLGGKKYWGKGYYTLQCTDTATGKKTTLVDGTWT